MFIMFMGFLRNNLTFWEINIIFVCFKLNEKINATLMPHTVNMQLETAAG